MRTIKWRNGVVVTVDQTELPHRQVYLKLKTPQQIAEAIKRLSIRGAPLLGAAAALALAQTAYKSKAKTEAAIIAELEKTCKLIRKTRPTAVNLFNSLDAFMKNAKAYDGKPADFKKSIVQYCFRLLDEDSKVNYVLSLKGAGLIGAGETVLTHCNAGELATVQYGTALGVITMAHRQGKRIKVIATETRPLLQGARLTAFELKREGIPFTLITDSMIGYVMQKDIVDRVVVGADRILTEGYVINKIGTYTIAVLAKRHGIPFHVAAPTSTIDKEKSVGEVTIEERRAEEVLEFAGKRVAPKKIKALNPAFDITPPELVTSIITEKDVVLPRPESIRKLCEDG